MKKVAAILLTTVTLAFLLWNAPARAYSEQQELIDKAIISLDKITAREDIKDFVKRAHVGTLAAQMFRQMFFPLGQQPAQQRSRCGWQRKQGKQTKNEREQREDSGKALHSRFCGQES